MNIKIGNKVKINIYIFVLALISSTLNAQSSAKIGAGSTNIDSNAVLELNSTNKGLLLPRLALVATDNASPMTGTITGGMTIYNTATSGTGATGVTPGFYYWNNSLWIRIAVTDSPTFTGVPVAPTPIANTNTTQLATTAFVLTNSDRYYSATSATEINTRTTSDEVVPGMSLTSELGGTYAVSFNAQYEIDPSDRTSQASVDMLAAYNALMALASTETIASAIPTRTFTPGVYNIAAAGTVAAGVIITLNGSGTYIFKFGAALSMGADVSVVLQGGASASDVFWIAEGAVAIGANANIKGNLISNSGAVDLAAGCTLTGKLLAINNGAISISGSAVNNTGITSSVNWGLIVSFSIFSKGGVISNAGASYVSGDIGTKIGSITTASFAPATITGTFYTALVGSALATFSVYQNGTLIANSKRLRSSTLHTVDVSLQAIATVGAGQSIDIRWSVDSGKITLKNRIITLISVR